MVDEYKDRLKLAMDAQKVSRQKLADVLGISYQAVRKVLLGESAGFDLANHNAACAFLGVHSDWLLTGRGPKDLGQRTEAHWRDGEASRQAINLRDALKLLGDALAAHNGIRRRVIGTLLAQMAEDPGNLELAAELAQQLEPPPAQQTEAA